MNIALPYLPNDSSSLSLLVFILQLAYLRSSGKRETQLKRCLFRMACGQVPVVSIDDLCGRNQPTVGGSIPRLIREEYLRKLAEHGSMSKPVIIFLVCLLPPRSFLELLPLSPIKMNCDLEV